MEKSIIIPETAVRVNSNEELGKAIQEKANAIVLEYDDNGVIKKVEVTGNVTWAVVIGACAVAITSIIATAVSGGATAPVAAVTTVAGIAAAGVSGWSLPLVAALISIGVAGKGIDVLKKLKKYKPYYLSDGKILLLLK